MKEALLFYLCGWSKTRARMCELHKENYNGSSSLAPHGDIASIQGVFQVFVSTGAHRDLLVAGYGLQVTETS